MGGKKVALGGRLCQKVHKAVTKLQLLDSSKLVANSSLTLQDLPDHQP